jgi:arylsulfatase A-like enzyme
MAQLRANPTLFNNSSHFEVFPTVLRLMGYPADEVGRLYGPSLFDSLPLGRERYYIAGFLSHAARSRITAFPDEQNSIAPTLHGQVMRWPPPAGP